MKKKKLFLLSLLVALTSAALFGFKEYYRRNKDLSFVNAELVIRDTALIASFTSRNGADGNRYIGRVVQVEGVIRQINKDVDGRIVVVLGRSTDPSTVRCFIDSVHVTGLTTWQQGQLASVKGMLVGFNPDETGMLGSDVELNRCVPVESASPSMNK